MFNVYKRPVIMAVCLSVVNPALSITPVLDGYAYQLFDDIVIDTTNNLIIINTDMINCEQPNGSLPEDNSVYALDNGSEFIGLQHVIYNIESQRIYFTSETSDLNCDNGLYVDTIFEDGFSGQIFVNGFE